MFIKQAGTIILFISVLLWFLGTYPKMSASETPAPVAQQVVLAQQVLFNCSAVTERTPARVGCAIRRTFARLRMAITKHVLKLAVLLSLGFSPIPFVLSFI